MSRSHGRATAQNFAEFAQNLEICTPKLKNSCIFTIFTCFCTFYVTFWVFFMHFLAQLFQKLSSDRAKKSTFRMSGAIVCSFCATDKQTDRHGDSAQRAELVKMWKRTHDSWHVTSDRWHATYKTCLGVNIISKYQLSNRSSLGSMGVKIIMI